ncbi:MAG: hypothetical protein DME57_00050 [Verrucomicrobia bacterium]|nr:MAG: hypothetical protein DME57_00050 [Verrucomicrobiota bacterium]
MKTPRRLITIALGLAVVACALFLTLRSFAQSGPYDIDLPSYQKLKAPYDNDVDKWETDILKKHSKKYCITHRKQNGDVKKKCPKSTADVSAALPVPVSETAAASGSDTKPTGINVTQNISCATEADKVAIEATFDN